MTRVARPLEVARLGLAAKPRCRPTAVRQRCAREVHDRRGRARDLAWASRRLLLRGADTLSTRAWDRLTRVFAIDDPTGQLAWAWAWAWAIKDHVRPLLATATLDSAACAMQNLHAVAKVTARPETDRLVKTLEAWWRDRSPDRHGRDQRP